MGCVQTSNRKAEVEQPNLTPAVLQQIAQNNQHHLLKYVSDLTQQQLLDYYRQIQSIDFPLLKKLHQDLIVNKQPIVKQDEIIDVIPNKLTIQDLETQKADLEDHGLKAIAQGQVAVILMAGGQGTRLNSKDPKGLLDPELPSQKTLFQIYTERLITLQKLAFDKHKDISKKGSSSDNLELIHFYIMTSAATDAKTKDFFLKANYFNYPKNCIHFFQQASMPALDEQGKVIVKQKEEIFLAPNGNGGLYQAVALGPLEEMKKNGIKYIHILGVDNILNKLADPILTGYIIKSGFQIVSKYVQKINSKEPVGAQILRNNVVSVIEYSELTEEQKQETLPNGNLKYGDSFMATFMITTEFLEEAIKRQSEWADYHLAHKKIEYFDEAQQQTIAPQNPNGYKFELFIFDCFKIAKQFGLMEVVRSNEFAPIKNAVENSQTDNLNTAKQLLVTLHQKWLTESGYKFEDIATNEQDKLCEIDPLVSYFGEGLQNFPPKYQDENEKSKLPFYLGPAKSKL